MTGLLGVILSSGGPVIARNTQLFLPVKPALEIPMAQEKLSGAVRFFFADQPHGNVLETLGSVKTTQKAKPDFRPDEEVCNEALALALADLEKRAKAAGANAVIGIVSDYKGKTFANPTGFECHAGSTGGIVVLKGNLVKLGNH